MGLEYPSEWRFEGIGESTPDEFQRAARDLVKKIVSGSNNPKHIYETFKSAFGDDNRSSNASFAEGDLYSAMRSVADNAVVYVDSLWVGIEELSASEKVPSEKHVNRLLLECGVPLQIDSGNLELIRGDIVITDAVAAEAEEGASPVYERHERIGRGGFGEVFRVSRTTEAGTFDFAMKVLNPSPFNERPEKAWKRFARELETLAKLQHRGIIAHLEAGKDNAGNPYILMPLIEGDDIHRSLSGRPLEDVVHTFCELLSALAYAHNMDVVHRDIKPTNVIIRASDCQPILLDFGCAYLLDAADSEALTTTLIGSQPYIPSEVISNPKLRSPQQDIYACGVLLYEVLATVRPDPQDYRPLSEVAEEYAGLDEVVMEAIAPASRRISSAEEFRDRLATSY